MPNYYGEVMQVYWAPIKKCWTARYKAARTVFDNFNSLVMTNCIFRGYHTKVKGHPYALIEGKLDLSNTSEPNGTSIACEPGAPPVFKWNDQIITVQQMIPTVWLLPNNRIIGNELIDAPEQLGPIDKNNQFAIPWRCEWHKNGTLVRSETITAVNQWSAVRFLLRLRTTNRNKGRINGRTLIYDDTRGNVVTVFPLTLSEENAK